MQVVHTAAGIGLTPASDTSTLLETANPKVIAAYGALGPAVTELDRIFGLRNQMTDLAGMGPFEWPICAIITCAASLNVLRGAQNVWQGDIEIVQFDLPFAGSVRAKRRRPRLGGAWLALVTGGYTVRLNTADEADAVLAAATLGTQAESRRRRGTGMSHRARRQRHGRFPIVLGRDGSRAMAGQRDNFPAPRPASAGHGPPFRIDDRAKPRLD